MPDRLITILVCGGRTYGYTQDPVTRRIVVNTEERDALYEAIGKHCHWNEPDDFGNSMPCDTVIIHGGAKGADMVADDWAVTHWVRCDTYKADWDTHPKTGGILRNILMLKEGKPDIVIAAKGGRGTAHMVRIAEEAGIPVVKVGW